MSFVGSIVDRSLKWLDVDKKTPSTPKGPNLETLCGFCASLFQKVHPILKSNPELLSFDLGDIHQSPVDFQEAVKRQCRLCMTRWRQLSSEEQRQVVEVVKRIDVSISVDLKENNIGIMYGYRLEHGGRSAKTIVKSIRLVPDEEMQRNVTPYKIKSSTALVNTLKIIEWWLDRCEKEHLSCAFNHSMRGTQRLPTRLIDLDTSSNATPVLCKGSELSPKTEYVSLSHCWGTYDPIKLTSKNIAEMETGIPVETLSKTFQDAMWLTRVLGFRYLWIDSLCIMQDSEDDWRREAASMKNIYMKATLNIAATAASDGREGLFYERDPISIVPHTVEIAWDGVCKGKYHFFNQNLWKEEVLDAPLGKRGWVLQERLLSSRIIHFGKNQLFWECQSNQCCETYPDMIPSDMFSVLGVWLNLNMWYDGVRLSASGKNCPEEFVPSVYALWNRIVQIYSRRAFTHNTDKLIALSGVAAVVSTLTHGLIYLAGLWDKTLPRSLLWMVNDPKSAIRPTAYIAPSWSWASVIGEVTCPPNVPLDGIEKTKEVVTILESGTSPFSTNVFGQIHTGFIRLSGPLMLATVGRNGSFIKLLGYDMVTAKVGADVGMFVEGQKLYCLPIYPEAGLCLELIGDVNGRYRRVGWWATEHPLGPAAVMALCQNFTKDITSRVAEPILEVERDLGDGEEVKRWVISIV